MNETLTLKEAADRLGMSPAVLRVYIHRNKILAHKRGSMWFLCVADVDRYQEVHAQAA